jgi:bifunctional ADP-heptose synthase (sugar kinase/adenylyltransferase)
MNILVVGDYIEDLYRICKLKDGQISPEMPLPKLELVREVSRPGAAGLVANNFLSLTGQEIAVLTGTSSRKERIGIEPHRHWLARIDQDATDADRVANFGMDLAAKIASPDFDLVIVSDYGKGSMSEPNARALIHECTRGRWQKPVFVDAKHHWEWYEGAYAFFPNEAEFDSNRFLWERHSEHLVIKQGAKGCLADNVQIPAAKLPGWPSNADPAASGYYDPPVVDVCGAGDVFLAAFVAEFVHLWTPRTEGYAPEAAREPASVSITKCARYANRAAAASVRHWGTCVVTPPEVSQYVIPERDESREIQ